MKPINKDLYDTFGSSSKYRKVLSKWTPEHGLLWLHKELLRRVRIGELCKIFRQTKNGKTLYAIVGA